MDFLNKDIKDVNESQMEGSVSQMFDLGLSFHFMKSEI